MVTWIFFGRVLPERFPLSVSLPTATVKQPELGIVYDSHVGIAEGQLVAEVTVTEGDVDIQTLRNLTERDIRLMTDMTGYQNGMAHDIEIISAFCRETAERCVFGVTVPILSERREGKFQTLIDGPLWLAYASDTGARLALSDFREAIKRAADTGFFCYRAVESMMQGLRPPNASDSAAWAHFRATLHVDRSALDYIKGHADAARHGRPGGVTDAERAKVFQLADEIIRRYLEYLVRDNRRLSEAEFPILRSAANEGSAKLPETEDSADPSTDSHDTLTK